MVTEEFKRKLTAILSADVEGYSRLMDEDEINTIRTQGVDQVIPIDASAVLHARNLIDNFPGLNARDLMHLSVCQLNKIKKLKTFDRNLLAAFKKS